jgi:hypothetical protein
MEAGYMAQFPKSWTYFRRAKTLLAFRRRVEIEVKPKTALQ